MKKQIKKIKLNKRTISNLNSNEMDMKAGGTGITRHCFSNRCTKGHTCNRDNCI